MTSRTEMNDLIERWHDLALLVSRGTEIDITEATAVINSVIKHFVPAQQPPTKFTGPEIGAFVSRVRDLERQWNQVLTRTLIEAHEAQSIGESERALAALDRFIDQCPWRTYVSIAEIERENIAGDTQ